jgi:hypothetical protein
LKLPFDFGIRFILRLVAPGALLAGICLPAVRALGGVIYPGVSDAVLYIAAGLVFGFGLLLLDMPIYMLLEGRRFWPGTIRNRGTAWQGARLASLRRKSSSQAGSMRIEYDILIAQYPVDRLTGAPYAPYPTRLGNLLASFETYPTIKYGLDGVFYWPRLWLAIDKDLREELDSAQAVVDGAIYCTFAFILSAVACLVYWWWIPSFAWWHWPAGAFACVLLSVCCYRLALPRYAQYGELFMAAFDQHRDKLKFVDLSALDTHMGQPEQRRSDREVARSSWRFLRWHRYRPQDSQQNVDVTNW